MHGRRLRERRVGGAAVARVEKWKRGRIRTSKKRLSDACGRARACRAPEAAARWPDGTLEPPAMVRGAIAEHGGRGRVKARRAQMLGWPRRGTLGVARPSRAAA